MSKQPNTEPQPDQPESAEAGAPQDALDIAEALKGQLRDVTGQVNDLISTLKRRKKQERLVASTLESLKQLRDVG